MALGYPVASTDDHYESQQFGPVPFGTPGYFAQPAMYGSSASAWWNADMGGTFYPHFHNGLDIAAPEGTPLRAMESGVIRSIGWGYIPGTNTPNGGGWVITVEVRPGTFYTFNHCDRFPVGLRYGAVVRRGQVIAYVGSSGSATGNHCHISLDIDTRGSDGLLRRVMYNPKRFMAGGAMADDPRIVSSIPPVELPDTGSGATGDDDVYGWIPSMKHQKPKPVIVRKGAVPLANPDGTPHSPGYSFPTETKLEVIGGLGGGGQKWAARRYGGDGLFLIKDSDVVRWP